MAGNNNVVRIYREKADKVTVKPSKLGKGYKDDNNVEYRVSKKKGDTITFDTPGDENIKIFIKPKVLSNTIPGEPEMIFIPAGNKAHQAHDIVMKNIPVDGVTVIYAVYCCDSQDWATGNSYPRIIIDP